MQVDELDEYTGTGQEAYNALRDLLRKMESEGAWKPSLEGDEQDDC